MKMIERDWGFVRIELAEYLDAHQISKNQLEVYADLQRSQLISYCRNQVQRPDLGVLARICNALNCGISDILKYYPPKP
ncbi:MAG: helix-turn-helix transcriptional regulator [Ruminococcaceae bacterium]|jgi:putative transcriptional regulator|nr:helix-turn-helix transcriptional regulator [Oscillospiraceae bacterium]